MISASALVRHCGHARLLKNRPPSDAKERAARARRDEAATRGTVFHAAIEAWVKRGVVPREIEDPEIQGWVDLLASQWAPPRGTMVETAWGLSHDGDGVPVTETEPHVYVPQHGCPPIITAGRTDAHWIDFDADTLYLVDWKTGRWPVTPPVANLQVNAAGIALAGGGAVAARYVPGIYYTRDGVFDWGEPVELGSASHHAMLEEVRAAALLDETPRPGPHCSSCWERRACAHAETA